MHCDSRPKLTHCVYFPIFPHHGLSELRATTQPVDTMLWATLNSKLPEKAQKHGIEQMASVTATGGGTGHRAGPGGKGARRVSVNVGTDLESAPGVMRGHAAIREQAGEVPGVEPTATSAASMSPLVALKHRDTDAQTLNCG